MVDVLVAGRELLLISGIPLQQNKTHIFWMQAKVKAKAKAKAKEAAAAAMIKKKKEKKRKNLVGISEM